jgi:hypothetical protein
LFSSNGSVSFEVGANLANLKVTSEANVSTLKVTGLANVSTLNVVGDANVAGKLSVTASSGDEGGEIFLAPAANTTLAGGITVDSYQNKIRFFEQGGTARGVYIDLTQCIGGAGTNLLGGTGTVTQVDTGNGLTGGPITSSGTVSVLANSGIIANATGLYVNSTYIATLAANSATYLGGNTAADLRSYSDTQAATAYSNAASYADSRAATAYTNAASYADTRAATAYTNAASYADTVAGTAYTNAIAYSSNATNISSGTLNAARLPASVVQNTDSRTLSGNLVISGTYFNPSANTILLGNSTQRWVVSANTIDASGLLTATSGANIQGTANLVDVNISGNLTVSGTTTYVNTTNLNVGDNIVTLNADLTGATAPTENAGLEVNRGSSANVNFLWNETSDSWTLGNTNITGYVNASASVNSAVLSVGASFIANTTGAYHTGTINSASYTVGSNFSANSTVVTTSDQIISTRTGSATDGDGQIFLNGGTSNRIDWAATGIGAPTVTSRSSGTKLVLYPAVAAASVDFGMGIDTNVLWSSVADTGDTFKWYANTTELFAANTLGITVSSGGIFPTSNNSATSLGSATQRWVLNANTGSFAGAVSGITTLAAGNTTITGFANVTSTIQGGSSLSIAGALSGVTTAAMGNTTITGFANATVSVNSALLTVGTSFIANTTGAYHTGTVNAVSFTTTNFIANTTGVYPLSNSAGTALGSTTQRWIITANTITTSGSGTIGTTLGVGNTTSGYINNGRTSPSVQMGYQQEKFFANDSTTYGMYVDTLINNTAYTTSRGHYGGYFLTIANTLSQNTLGSTISTDTYGLASFVYNAESAGGDSRLNDMQAFYAEARNYANGAVANTVDVMYAYRGLTRNFGTGVVTTAYGLNVIVGAANTTTTGNVTTAYGVYSGVASNTAMTIGTGYLFYGTHTGSTTTSKFGVYVTGESNNYFSSNVSIAGSLALTGRLVANGTSGTAGQVLHSNGTSIYWDTDDSGSSAATVTDDTATNGTRYLTFANQTSGTLSTIYTDSTGLTFNPSTGTVTAAVFSATSDERQKANINIITESLTKIQKIKGITFNYKQSGNPGVGVLAQDVEYIFPELVSINSDGYKSVAYDGLIGLLIEAIKDQQQQIQILSEKIDSILEKTR